MARRINIAGVDEVGRGPLIGSVVASACILPEGYTLEGLTDSKKLSEKKRQMLSQQLQNDAVAWSIAEATSDEIDQINILQASLLAMKRAVEALSVQPDHVLVDGNRLPNWHYDAQAVVGGDAIEPTISAASIIAKVYRDQQMQELGQRYPEYGFEKHKGYPTKQHLQALRDFGVLSEHRRSFKPIRKELGLSLGK